MFYKHLSFMVLFLGLGGVFSAAEAESTEKPTPLSFQEITREDFENACILSVCTEDELRKMEGAEVSCAELFAIDFLSKGPLWKELNKIFQEESLSDEELGKIEELFRHTIGEELFQCFIKSGFYLGSLEETGTNRFKKAVLAMRMKVIFSYFARLYIKIHNELHIHHPERKFEETSSTIIKLITDQYKDERYQRETLERTLQKYGFSVTVEELEGQPVETPSTKLICVMIEKAAGDMLKHVPIAVQNILFSGRDELSFKHNVASTFAAGIREMIERWVYDLIDKEYLSSEHRDEIFEALLVPNNSAALLDIFVNYVSCPFLDLKEDSCLKIGEILKPYWSAKAKHEIEEYALSRGLLRLEIEFKQRSIEKYYQRPRDDSPPYSEDVEFIKYIKRVPERYLGYIKELSEKVYDEEWGNVQCTFIKVNIGSFLQFLTLFSNKWLQEQKVALRSLRYIDLENVAGPIAVDSALEVSQRREIFQYELLRDFWTHSAFLQAIAEALDISPDSLKVPTVQYDTSVEENDVSEMSLESTKTFSEQPLIINYFDLENALLMVFGGKELATRNNIKKLHANLRAIRKCIKDTRLNKTLVDVFSTKTNEVLAIPAKKVQILKEYLADLVPKDLTSSDSLKEGWIVSKILEAVTAVRSNLPLVVAARLFVNQENSNESGIVLLQSPENILRVLAFQSNNFYVQNGIRKILLKHGDRISQETAQFIQNFYQFTLNNLMKASYKEESREIDVENEIGWHVWAEKYTPVYIDNSLYRERLQEQLVSSVQDFVQREFFEPDVPIESVVQAFLREDILRGLVSVIVGGMHSGGSLSSIELPKALFDMFEEKLKDKVVEGLRNRVQREWGVNGLEEFKQLMFTKYLQNAAKVFYGRCATALLMCAQEEIVFNELCKKRQKLLEQHGDSSKLPKKLEMGVSKEALLERVKECCPKLETLNPWPMTKRLKKAMDKFWKDETRVEEIITACLKRKKA